MALACGPWLVRLAESESHVGAVGSAFWRLALASPILLIASATAREPMPARKRIWIGVALLSGLFFAADLALWHLGILHTRIANATLLGNITAILFPAYGFLFARRMPSRRQSLALLLAAGGAMLMLGRSIELSPRHAVGDLLCIGAGICYTLYLVAVDRARAAMGPISTLTLSVFAGAPVLLVTALLLGDPIAPAAWTPLILLAAGSQLVGQGLILFSVGRVAPLVVGVMLLVQPIIAAAIGWLAYGERLTWPDLAGGIAIAVAVMLVHDAGRALPERAVPLSRDA